jgi:hypothetical protein
MQGMAAGISVGLVTAVPPQLEGPGVGPECASWQQQQQQQGTDEAGAAAGPSSSGTSEMAGYSCYVFQGPGQLSKLPGAAAAAAAVAGTVEEDEQQQRDDVQAEDSSSSSSDESGSDSSSSSSSCDDEQPSSSSSSSGLLPSSYGPALLLTDIQGNEDHHGDMDFKVIMCYVLLCYLS